MGKRRKSGQKTVKPDDYFAWRPIELARFGKVVIGRSRATAEQFAEAQTRAAELYPSVVAEIDELVLSIAKQVARLPPARLLHRAWWEHAAVVLRLNRSASAESDQIDAVRMIDYVQSVIAAVNPGPYTCDVSDDDWQQLKSDVHSLFTRLTLEYQLCFTAHRKKHDPNLDLELEGFRARAEMLWLNIRGKRYQPQERQALLDVLAPHSDILLTLFGISATALVDELDKILAKLTRGLADAMLEMKRFRDDSLDRLEMLAANSTGAALDELMRRVFEDAELAKRGRTVIGEVFGMDLFDVTKNVAIPKALLAE